MNEKLKNLVPPILTGDSVDPDRIMDKTLTIMSLLLDDIRLSIQQFPHIVKQSYVDIDRTPNGIMQTLLAESQGIKLSNIKNSENTDRDKTIFQVWNRILNNLFYILKTKGTPQALKYIMVIYGIDPYKINFTEKSIVNSSDYYIKSINKRHSFLTSGSANFNYYGLTSNGNFALEIQVKQDTVGTLLNWVYHGGQLIINVNNGSITGTFGSSSSSLTTTLSSQSTNSYYLISVQKNGNNIDMFRHNIVSNQFNTTTSIPVFTSLTSTIGGLSAFIIDPRIQFGSSLSGGISELKTWSQSPSNTDIEYRLFNWESIASTAGTSSLLSYYKFNEQQSLSANLNNYDWFINSSNSSITSQISTPSFSGDPLSSVYTYLVHNRMDLIETFGVQPTNTKISISGLSNVSNLFSLGYEPSNSVNEFIFNRDRSFNMVNLYGNNEEYYSNSLSSIDQYLNVVFSEWRGRFINLSKYDEIIDSTEYMLASFFEFIKQFTSIKSEIIESGNIIKNHILSNISHKRKDSEIDNSYTNNSIEFKNSINNQLIEYLTNRKTYTNKYETPQLNKYYRDNDGNIVTPIETTSDDESIKIYIQPTGSDYIIISNENEDLPYNFIDQVVYVTDEEGDALVGSRVRLTADGRPDRNAWQFIDLDTLDTFIFTGEFLNPDEDGFNVRIKYDASAVPFTELNNGIYSVSMRTSNLGKGSISKSINAQLARNIQASVKSYGKFTDYLIGDPFIKLAINMRSYLKTTDSYVSQLFVRVTAKLSTYLKIRDNTQTDVYKNLFFYPIGEFIIIDEPIIVRTPMLKIQSYDPTKFYKV